MFSHHLCTSSWPLETRTGWAFPNSGRPNNTPGPSQERAGGILGFSNENLRWHSTLSPKAQHWNHSGSDTFITAHKADGWSLKGLWSLQTSGQAQGEPSVQGCLVERKPHSTLHKPPEPWEKHTEIKTQWTASFCKFDLTLEKVMHSKSEQKGQLEHRIQV